jgi:hypothetical protein
VSEFVFGGVLENGRTFGTHGRELVLQAADRTKTDITSNALERIGRKNDCHLCCDPPS